MLVLILAGCGGSGNGKWQQVQGKRLTFDAPAGWDVSGTAASSGVVNRVEVNVFELEHPYLSSKRVAIARELNGDAADLAQQLRGTVSSRSALEVDGLPARAYSIAYDDKVEEITFVFRGSREYELLCRRSAGAGDGACRELVSSFRIR